MADVIKIFHDVGSAYGSDPKTIYNELSRKRIDEILLYHIDTNESDEYIQPNSTKAKPLILRIVANNIGNLYPFLAIAPTTLDGIPKAFNNMREFLNDEEKVQLDQMQSSLQMSKIKEALDRHQKEADKDKVYYLALLYKNRYFNEYFPQVFERYIRKINAEDSFSGKPGECFIQGENRIGYDAQLNFCSTNEMSKGMESALKYRLLPLGKEGGKYVRMGFEKVFKSRAFLFKLFGMPYMLLPSVFAEEKKPFFDEVIEKSQNRDQGESAVRERAILDEELQEIAEEFEDKPVLLTLLFFDTDGKNKLDLTHTIEDVIPSRISTIAKKLSMDGQYSIESGTLSKYVKKTDKKENTIYIRDYIDDPLLLAKLYFGKEQLNPEFVYRTIFNKIMYGNNRDKEKRPFSDILNGYYKQDVSFELHQKYIEFLSDSDVAILKQPISLQGGSVTDNLEQWVHDKLNNVPVLRDANHRERYFYLCGVLATLVIFTQKRVNKEKGNSSSLENDLNTIGLVSQNNIERVFNTIRKGAQKYWKDVFKFFQQDYNVLEELCSETFGAITKEEKVSQEKANILFVMGSANFRKYLRLKQSKEGEHNADSQAE